MSTSMQNPLEKWLKYRVLICVGSGGVGKTTISSSIGVLAAEKGLKVLTMTIDPSLRLREALGLTENTSRSVRVPNQNFKGSLDASLLNSEEIFEDFIRKASREKHMADRLVKNRLYQLISTTLSGSQEFTSLLQLSRIVESNQYDLVILDTPPAQHAIDFLQAPQKLESLFQESIVKWFINEKEEQGFVRRLVSRGTRTVLSILEKITGSTFMAELADFFSSIQAVQSKIVEKTGQVQEILSRADTGFLLVTGFDEVKMKEAIALKDYLELRKFHLIGALVNRSMPIGFEPRAIANDGREASRKLSSLASEFANYYAKRREVFEKFKQQLATGARVDRPVIRIPDFSADIVGLKSLSEVANEIEKRSQTLS